VKDEKSSLIIGITLLISVGIFPLCQVFAQTTSGQFKEYAEQYGRFSIQLPKDWTIGSPHVKQESDTVSFSSNNGDNVLFIVTASDRHHGFLMPEASYEQIVREENAATIAHTPGATLIQDTECTEYVINGHKACSVVYTVTNQQYTEKDMDISFHTAKQEVLISISGSAFDKYLPASGQMLNSMKVS
jgi:hypothetical protein